MKEQLIKAWQINNSNNILLVRSLDKEALSKTLSAKGGRHIGAQLAHVHNVRVKWLEFVAKEMYDSSLLLEDKEPSQTQLEKAFDLSAEKIIEVINTSWERDGKLSSFKTGLIPFISYLISHESHHRGNILLTLKQAGVKLDDKVKYGLWEWGK
jgi:uncharacterized damage-inducible protein DinB